MLPGSSGTGCTAHWRCRLRGGWPTFGLGGGGEKLTCGLLMTPSDIEAVAEAKCLLLLLRLPLRVMPGSSAACSSKVYDGFNCSALAALVLNVILSAIGWVTVRAACQRMLSTLLSWSATLVLTAIKYLSFSSLLSSPLAHKWERARSDHALTPEKGAGMPFRTCSSHYTFQQTGLQYKQC